MTLPSFPGFPAHPYLALASGSWSVNGLLSGQRWSHHIGSTTSHSCTTSPETLTGARKCACGALSHASQCWWCRGEPSFPEGACISLKGQSPGLQASAEGHATPEPSERPGPAWPRRLGQRFLRLCPVISSNNNWSLVGPGSQWIEYSDVCSHHFRTFGFSWSTPCPLLEDSEEVYFPLSLKPVTFFKALNKIGENSFLLAKE